MVLSPVIFGVLIVFCTAYMVYDFAETCVFGNIATSSVRRYPFSRSYGAILPSSLARVVWHPQVFSTYLPVSVLGTGTHLLKVV